MKSIMHYAFILDQSGSMCNLVKEVITGFKEQVEAIGKMNEKNPDVEIMVTLCVFNDVIDFRYIDQGIERLNPLKPDEYSPDSLTSLYDALGTTMVKLENLVKDSEKVFIVVFTDGCENASTEFSSTDIKNLLARAEDNKWDVRFFCDGKDQMFYESELGTTGYQMNNISLNEAGFNEMRSEICYSLNRMIDSCYIIKDRQIYTSIIDDGDCPIEDETI